MSFDERALLVEQELWIAPPPRRSRRLDGPIWWLGPILVLVGVGALIPRSPAPRAPERQTPAETTEPAHEAGEAIASASTSFSRN